MNRLAAVALLACMAASCGSTPAARPWWAHAIPEENRAGECGGICSGGVQLHFDLKALQAVETGKCNVLRLCVGADEPQGSCFEWSFDDSPWAKANPAQMEVPCDGALSMTLECYSRDPNDPEKLVGPHLTGTLGQVEGGSDCSFGKATLFVWGTGAFMGTCTIAPGEESETPTSTPTGTTDARWGAVAERLVDGTVLIAGGAEPADTCTDWAHPDCAGSFSASAERYAPALGTFVPLGSQAGKQMTHPRAFAASVLLPDGRVAVFGGFRGVGEVSSTVDLFDRASATFTAGPPMQESRARHTATLISELDGGYVLLVGGHGTGLDSWEVWNPEAGTVGSGMLHEGRRHHTATPVTKAEDSAVKLNSVFIAGGEADGAVRTSVEIFDIDANALAPAPLPYCKNGGGSSIGLASTMGGAALFPKRHMLWHLGGFEDLAREEPTGEICIWNSVKEKWIYEAGTFLLPEGRAAFSITPLASGCLAVLGGLTGFDGDLHGAEHPFFPCEYLNDKGETVLDASAGEHAMIVPRWDHLAVALDSQTILVVGGLTGTPAAPEVVLQGELYH